MPRPAEAVLMKNCRPTLNVAFCFVTCSSCFSSCVFVQLSTKLFFFICFLLDSDLMFLPFGSHYISSGRILGIDISIML